MSADEKNWARLVNLARRDSASVELTVNVTDGGFNARVEWVDWSESGAHTHEKGWHEDMSAAIDEAARKVLEVVA